MMAAAIPLFLLAQATAVLNPPQLLSGQWSNAAQVATSDPALARPPAAGHPYDWLDHQHATFTPVVIPALPGQAVHLVWRSGGPDGPISRQRLWLFRQNADGQTVMDFFTPKTPETMAAPAPGAILLLKPDELVGYGSACTLRVITTASGFAAEIPPTCTITARSGRAMTLSATIKLDGATLTYSEAGRLPDGRFAFKVPGGPPYRFDRRD